MAIQITEAEEGKQVVDSRGETVGVIEEVRAGTAYVNPDPGITDTVKSQFGWGDADEDTYELHDRRIESITDHEVRLNDTQ